MTTAQVGLGIAAVSLLMSIFTLVTTRLVPPRLALAAEPPSFGTTFTAHGHLAIRFPIVVENRGARTGVVGGLRFAVPREWSSSEDFAFAHSVWENVDPRRGEGRFYEPLAIRGGEVTVGICEFNVANVSRDDVRAATYDLTLEMPSGSRRGVDAFEWRTLGRFRLVITEHERSGFGTPCAHFNGFRS